MDDRERFERGMAAIATAHADMRQFAAQIARDRQSFRYGHTATIITAGSQPGAADVVYLDGADLAHDGVPKPLTLVMQTASAPAVGMTVTATVRQIVGASVFTRTFTIGAAIKTLNLTASALQVSVTAVGGGGSPVTVNAAVFPADLNPLGMLAPSWVQSTGLAISGTIASAAGVFLGAQGCITNVQAPDTQYWVMFFDSASVPAGGTAPLVALGPFGLNGIFSFDRSLRADVQFNSGLTWALSTTGGTFTAATAGATARVDADFAT